MPASGPDGRPGVAALERFVSEAPLGLTMVDLDGVMLAVSDQAVQEIGLPREAIIGRTGHALFRGGGAVWDDLIARGAPFRPVVGQLQRIELPGGDANWIQITATPWRRETGEIGGMVLLVRNATVEQRALAQRSAAEAALQRALEDAEAANRAKTDFLATMSHEIRTPLNGVLGMAQAMARDRLSPAQHSRLEILRQSGEALLAVLNDILDLSKVEAGKLELEAIDFDLAHVVEAAAAGFAPLAAGKGLRLLVETAGARAGFRGDPTRIGQIVSNLISNAVKFTEVGEVRVTAAAAGETVEISVADTGPGIAPEALERLFDVFVQADSSTTRRYGGSGLGLSICRRLAELMGGTIAAESRPGEGARFTLALRLGPAQGAVGPRHRREAEVHCGDAALEVLAAEDNPVNQQVLKAIFEQVGVSLTVVGDGVTAVSAFRARPWDVVLMDVRMPLLDGPDATRAIRAFERESGRRRTPIIALTANAMEHQKAEYLAAGMDRLVAKPLQIAELFQAIHELTQDRPGDQALAG